MWRLVRAGCLIGSGELATVVLIVSRLLLAVVLTILVEVLLPILRVGTVVCLLLTVAILLRLLVPALGLIVLSGLKLSSTWLE